MKMLIHTHAQPFFSVRSVLETSFARISGTSTDLRLVTGRDGGVDKLKEHVWCYANLIYPTGGLGAIMEIGRNSVTGISRRAKKKIRTLGGTKRWLITEEYPTRRAKHHQLMSWAKILVESAGVPLSFLEETQVWKLRYDKARLQGRMR